MHPGPGLVFTVRTSERQSAAGVNRLVGSGPVPGALAQGAGSVTSSITLDPFLGIRRTL